MNTPEIAFHVVTERPMHAGQILRFDHTTETGVARRVREKSEAVREIYAHPDRYDADSLEHHTRVALRELALEEIRLQKYPHFPSRLHCLYVSATLEETEMWAESFVRWQRPTFHIVRVALHGRVFSGDAYNCFSAATSHSSNLLLAERYWSNLPNLKNLPPMRELLADGTVEVLEIVREIHKNI